MNDLLTVRGVEKTYQKGLESFHVLKGIELALRQGEFLTVVGPSGAGKSTLLHLMGTLIKPTAGQVFWQGKNIFSLKDIELSHWRNQKIGFIFQFHHLLPEFTVLENVVMPGIISGRGSLNPWKDKAIALLDKVGLKDRLSSRPSELSGGEQQRVALARALIHDPLVLLADEPTGNLDKAGAENVFSLMEQFHREKKLTVVMVTHHEAFAKRSQRTIRMEDGRIVDGGRNGS